MPLFGKAIFYVNRTALYFTVTTPTARGVLNQTWR